MRGRGTFPARWLRHCKGRKNRAVRTRCSSRELRLSVLYFPFSEATPTSEKTVRSTFDISCCRLLKVTVVKKAVKQTSRLPTFGALNCVVFRLKLLAWR